MTDKRKVFVLIRRFVRVKCNMVEKMYFTKINIKIKGLCCSADHCEPSDLKNKKEAYKTTTKKNN